MSPFERLQVHTRPAVYLMRWRIEDDASVHYLEQVAVGREYGECYSTRSAFGTEQRSTTHRDRRTWTWFGLTSDTATTDTSGTISMSDDEIEIVEKNIIDKSQSGTNDICQLCPTNLHTLSATAREEHYRKHYPDETTSALLEIPLSVPLSPTRLQRHGLGRGRQKPSPVTTSRRTTTPMKFGRSAENAAQEDVFWYPTLAKAPPDNYTPGVLSILKEALKKSHRKGVTQRAVLCYERTPHIYHESFDSSWGCGYRNFLMTCAALMDQQFQSVYFAHLDSPSPPGVRNLQKWLEDAWKDGYDDIGARDFNHKLVNTKKKLGTGGNLQRFTVSSCEDYTAHFDLTGFNTLTEWVVNYFTEKPEGDVNKILRTASPVVATRKMPVIMQYDGHSITIVGYELGKNNKYNLLVFNPSSKVHKDLRQAALDVSTGVDWASSSSVSLGKSKRRERSKSPASRKRSRMNEDPDDGVVSICDSDDEDIDDARRDVALKSTLDPDTVIKSFRLKGPKQKPEYQLLYFTMGDPLSDQEQNDRKVVFSVPEY
ncbi:peptidase family C78-domain-containing protein [Butyriboletus roseoflavus]|nr:peptidase family C78-domain-containing protein [Butyriboletus roseoflavus]